MSNVDITVQVRNKSREEVQ